jgi:hypothetical protein
MSDYLIPLHFAPCMHRRLVVETSGRRDFIQGEVFDNIQERLFCLECGMYLTETEIRSRWNDGWPEVPLPPKRR